MVERRVNNQKLLNDGSIPELVMRRRVFVKNITLVSHWDLSSLLFVGAHSGERLANKTPKRCSVLVLSDRGRIAG